MCVFSDFFDERADALKRLLALRARKHDVAVFHLVDPAELEFPYDDPTLFLSMEDERRVEVNPREIKQSYLEEFGRFLEETRTACTAADCDYERVRTDEPLDQVLLRFLGAPRRPAVTFAHPFFLFGMLAALIPLLVHLFDRRRPRHGALRRHRLRAQEPAPHRFAAAAQAAAPLPLSTLIFSRVPIAWRARSSPAPRR